MANRYTFKTKLTGFIKIDEDGGKYNNRTFSYTIPSEKLEEIERDRVELIEWIKSKSTGRKAEGVPAWDENGVAKYTYGEGDGTRKKLEPIFVDTDGAPLSKEYLASVRKGTVVNLIVDQKPWPSSVPTLNTSLKVVGVQIVELVTGNGAVDSGNLSVEDVAKMFGKTDGFKADSPAVRDARPAEASADSYDF